MYVCMYVCMYVNLCIYVCMYVCTHVCMYMYMAQCPVVQGRVIAETHKFLQRPGGGASTKGWAEKCVLKVHRLFIPTPGCGPFGPIFLGANHKISVPDFRGSQGFRAVVPFQNREIWIWRGADRILKVWGGGGVFDPPGFSPQT